MQTNLAALALILFASSFVLAQTTPGTGAAGEARPARGPDQTSTPSTAPPATTQQTTGTSNQSPVVKQMNEAEQKKVETHGK